MRRWKFLFPFLLWVEFSFFFSLFGLIAANFRLGSLLLSFSRLWLFVPFFFFFFTLTLHIFPLFFAAVREGLLVTMIFAAVVIKFSDIFRFVMGENDAVIRSSAGACKL